MGRKKEVINPKMGERIKEVRKKLNLTQNEFAEKYDVSEQSVRNWEAGRRRPSTSTLEKISYDSNTDISYLLCFNEVLEETIDTNTTELEKDILVQYLESIGYEVMILPQSGHVEVMETKVKGHVWMKYEIYKEGYPIRAFDINSWKEFKNKCSTMIDVLLK